MDNLLGINLVAGLDKDKTVSKINGVITQISGDPKLNSVDLKINVDDNVVKSIKEITEQVKSMGAEIDKLNNKLKNLGVNRGSSKELKDQAKHIDSTSKASKGAQRQSEKMSQAYKAEAQELEKLNRQIKNRDTALSKETWKFDANNKPVEVQQTFTDDNKAKTHTAKWEVDEKGDRLLKGSTVSTNLERENKEIQRLAQERERAYEQLRKIEQKGYGQKGKIDAFSSKIGTAESIDSIKNIRKEIKLYGEDVDLVGKKSGIEKTIKSLQNLHKDGSINLPRNNMLTDISKQLNAAKTTKEIDAVKTKLQDLRTTVLPGRTKMFEDIESLRDQKLLDPKELTQFRERVRRAESPRQTTKLRGELDSLIQENNAIKNSNKVLSDEVALRSRLLQKLEKMRTSFGANQGVVQMFTNQATNADLQNLKRLETNVRDYEASLKSLKDEERIRTAQHKMQYDVAKLRRAVDGRIDHKQETQIQNYLKSMNEIDINTPGWEQKIRRIQMSFSNFRDEVVHLDTGLARFSKQMASAMLRVPIYAATIAAMYSPMRMFQDALRQTIEIDTQMTVLERVSGGAIDMNQALESSIDIADRLGNTIAELNEGLISFARQGYRGDDLIAITEVATLMSNVSDLSVDEASSSLTAAMKGFNIEAEDSIHIVNALNEVNVNQPPCTVMCM